MRTRPGLDLAVSLALLPLCLTACSTDLPTTPGPNVDGSLFSLDCGGSGCGGGSIRKELIATTQLAGPNGTALSLPKTGLPYFAERTVIGIDVDGGYDVIYNTGPSAGLVWKHAGPEGFLAGLGTQCWGAVVPWYYNTGTLYNNDCASADPYAVKQYIIAAMWSGSVSRGGGTDQFCQDNLGKVVPCWRYQGSAQTVTVSRLRPNLSLTRLNPPTQPPRDSVAVQARVAPNPGSANGNAFPIRIVDWVWLPTQAGVTPRTVVNCVKGGPWTGYIDCLFTAKESGTLTVKVRINGGSEESASITVNVVKCLTGDPLLDGDPALRAALRAAMDASLPNGPAKDRMERGGGRYCTGSSCTDQLWPVGPLTTPCANQADGSFGWPTIWWHVHPFIPGRLSADTLPRPQCWPPPDTPPAAAQGAKAWPSPADARQVWENGIPMYVVDKSYIYFIPVLGIPPTSPAAAAVSAHLDPNNVKKYDRLKCNPLAF